MGVIKKKLFKIYGYEKIRVECPDCGGEQKSRCCCCDYNIEPVCPECCPPCKRCKGNGYFYEII